MPSPLVAHTVHDIIASVENESPSRPSLFGISSDRRLRRARTLVTEGLNILRLLGDELTARERVEYDTVHSLIENTMHTTTSAYLEAAERLWDFALRTFQDVNHRSITACRRPQSHTSRPPDPPRVRCGPCSAPSVHYVQWYPTVRCTTGWTPVSTWWAPSVPCATPISAFGLCQCPATILELPC
ncbi:hypothetical protein AcW1_008698 [Taiwanofungus camphoratus]|nr:hypothetical protein AcV5_006719 [Antrodia cinnamomea]KAI0948970.1 hypothetical protein AcW1_008698 [Antrodia cinnamomea]